METIDSNSEDTTQKRKRRPKSYQGCTQCRLARRKCGEGMSRRLSSGNPYSCNTSVWRGIIERSFLLKTCLLILCV